MFRLELEYQFDFLANNYVKSIQWRLAEFYYNRSLQRLYTSTCTVLQEMINGFLCPLIVSLEIEIHQLNFEGSD